MHGTLVRGAAIKHTHRDYECPTPRPQPCVKQKRPLFWYPKDAGTGHSECLSTEHWNAEQQLKTHTEYEYSTPRQHKPLEASLSSKAHSRPNKNMLTTKQKRIHVIAQNAGMHTRIKTTRRSRNGALCAHP